MKQGQKNETTPRVDPAAADPRNYGGKGSRRVQGHEPREAHYDPSGRWAERAGTDAYREEAGNPRERFAQGAEWDFRPDADTPGKPKRKQ